MQGITWNRTYSQEVAFYWCCSAVLTKHEQNEVLSIPFVVVCLTLANLTHPINLSNKNWNQVQWGLKKDLICFPDEFLQAIKTARPKPVGK